jgi:hypothetical protein
MPLGEMKVDDNQNQQFAVGMGFLSRFKRYAFFPARMMFCYDAPSLEQNVPPMQRSIAVRYANQQIEVFYNDDAELQKTGLKNGDVLLKVNGTIYPPNQIGQIRKQLALTPAGKLKLTILRSTQQMDINL